MSPISTWAISALCPAGDVGRCLEAGCVSEYRPRPLSPAPPLPTISRVPPGPSEKRVPKPPKPIRFKGSRMIEISQNRPKPNPFKLSCLFSVDCTSKTPLFCKKIVAPGSPKPPNPFKLSLTPSVSYLTSGALQTHCDYPELFQWLKRQKGPVFEQRIVARAILVPNRPRRSVNACANGAIGAGWDASATARRDPAELQCCNLPGGQPEDANPHPMAGTRHPWWRGRLRRESWAYARLTKEEKIRPLAGGS